MTARDPAALRAQPARNGFDLWRTPPDLIAALNRFVLPALRADLNPPTICEPGSRRHRRCTGGARTHDQFGRPYRAAEIRLVASDVVPSHASVMQHDFLHADPLIADPETTLIKNPHYNDLDAFVALALALLDPRRGRSPII